MYMTTQRIDVTTRHAQDSNHPTPCWKNALYNTTTYVDIWTEYNVHGYTRTLQEQWQSTTVTQNMAE